VRALLVALLALTAGFVLVTWLALEKSDVAVVETHARDGATRSTHVWFVEHEGQLWLEAGTPENAWFLDVLREPRLVLSTDGSAPRELVASPVRTPEAQQRVRAMLREKYGWRDRWIGAFVDAKHSVAVRLTPPE